jgi:hypothetical protein
MSLGTIGAGSAPLRRFLAHCGGSLTIPAIFLFAVLMGVGGLAIDLQRLYGAHGQIQAYVDEVALASAAELDGQSGALTRAFDAANGGGSGPLVSGSSWQTLAKDSSNSATLTLQKVTFLSQLDADPGAIGTTPTALEVSKGWVLCTYTTGTGWAPANCNTDTAKAAAAKFVEVVGTQQTVSYVVLPVVRLFVPATTDAQLQGALQLRATAGFRRAICNSVPMMVCNPSEVTQGVGADFTAADWNGKQISAKISGQNADWTPGNFGLTNNYPGMGADAMEEAMANVNSGATCTEDNIQPRNGEATNKVQNGMNVRFDIYVQDVKNYYKNSTYLPAPNVVKGEVPKNGDACSVVRSATSIPFPRDNCFMVAVPAPGVPGSGCTSYPAVGGTPRYGDGNWARAQYWAANHPTDPQPPGYIDATKLTGGMSRYETYRYEIEHPQQVSLPMDEQGAPACSTTAPNTNRDHDRRVLYVAVVNCIEHGPAPVGDNALKNNQFVPVKAYAKVFITEPVGNADWDSKARGGLTWPSITPQDFMVEVFDVVKPNDQSGHLHVYPVLYR